MVEIPFPDISSPKTQSVDLFCFSILMYNSVQSLVILGQWSTKIDVLKVGPVSKVQKQDSTKKLQSYFYQIIGCDKGDGPSKFSSDSKLEDAQLSAKPSKMKGSFLNYVVILDLHCMGLDKEDADSFKFLCPIFTQRPINDHKIKLSNELCFVL